jgi:hypothetical protein
MLAPLPRWDIQMIYGQTLPRVVRRLQHCSLRGSQPFKHVRRPGRQVGAAVR